ncbi:MAG: hypothetical protein KC492_39650, partial [Myxococcales bacterium]|nr:hypothetical protein [Myxococcales bacterium]
MSQDAQARALMGESTMTARRWFVLLLVLLPAVVAPAASAQDVDTTPIPSPEATIAALQTRVAELEALLTPSPAAETAADAGIDESGKLFGPGVALLPPGEPGEVSVVLVGPYGTWLPVVIRNNT